LSPHPNLTSFCPLGDELKILETLWGQITNFLKYLFFFFKIKIKRGG